MVVGCWSEGGKWRIDEKTASLIAGLRVLFQDKKDKYGIEYVCYVVLSNDPLSPYYDFEEDDKKKTVAHAVWGNTIPIKAIKSAPVIDACEEYLRISNTVPAQMMAAVERAMKEATKHLNTVTINAENVDEVMKMTDKMPGYFENYKKVREKVKIEEGNLIMKIKGDGTLSWAEEEYIGKVG